MNYYKVICKIGHCGAGKHKDIVLYFKCKDALTAMKLGQNMPCVKHKLCPKKVIECSKFEYDMYHTNAYKRVM